MDISAVTLLLQDGPGRLPLTSPMYTGGASFLFKLTSSSLNLVYSSEDFGPVVVFNVFLAEVLLRFLHLLYSLHVISVLGVYWEHLRPGWSEAVMTVQSHTRIQEDDEICSAVVGTPKSCLVWHSRYQWRQTLS